MAGEHDLQCRVSVLLPVYDGARFLPVALQSLDAQTENDFEIVAVDDGSSDESAEILGFSPRVKLLSQPHRGLVAALNHGLESARGKYIARMDADDIADSDRLKCYLDANPKVGVVAGSANIAVDWSNSHIGYQPQPRRVTTGLDVSSHASIRLNLKKAALPRLTFSRVSEAVVPHADCASDVVFDGGEFADRGGFAYREVSEEPLQVQPRRREMDVEAALAFRRVA